MRVFVSKPLVPQGHHLHDRTEVACLLSLAVQPVNPPKSLFLFLFFLHYSFFCLTFTELSCQPDSRRYLRASWIVSRHSVFSGLDRVRKPGGSDTVFICVCLVVSGGKQQGLWC